MTPSPLSRVRLPRSGLEVSRLGLGLSRLHYLRSGRDREALVHGAIDLGVTHFDTARLYGDGLSERALGTALQGRRGRVTIATKFGLLPNALIENFPAAAFALRAARAAGQRLKLLSGPRRAWDAASLARSLHASLRALRTDFVDILFLHDARDLELQGRDDTIAALLDLRTQGKVRFLGVAGDFAQVRAIARRFAGVFDVIQTSESSWSDDLVPDFTFGALSQGPQFYGAAGPSKDQAETGVIRALARRPVGAVLVGTAKLGHLQDLVRAATQDPS